jgi:hypothetical protein
MASATASIAAPGAEASIAAPVVKMEMDVKEQLKDSEQHRRLLFSAGRRTERVLCLPG